MGPDKPLTCYSLTTTCSYSHIFNRIFFQLILASAALIQATQGMVTGTPPLRRKMITHRALWFATLVFLSSIYMVPWLVPVWETVNGVIRLLNALVSVLWFHLLIPRSRINTQWETVFITDSFITNSRFLRVNSQLVVVQPSWVSLTDWKEGEYSHCFSRKSYCLQAKTYTFRRAIVFY